MSYSFSIAVLVYETRKEEGSYSIKLLCFFAPIAVDVCKYKNESEGRFHK